MKMKVDIWSDIRCPFCYIGKHKFEAALDKFAHKNKVEVNWRSFELDPTLKTQPGVNITDFLARIKGITREQAEGMNNHVIQSAAEVGLTFDFDKVIVANSFNAHRILQLAKTKGLGAEAEEQFFKAHFSDGRNIDDQDTLIQIGRAAGLKETDLKDVLASNAFADQVRQDVSDARSIGVRGVPFFVLNNRYAVSGAQSPAVFLQTLEKAWAEFDRERKALIINDGDTCSTDGDCR